MVYRLKDKYIIHGVKTQNRLIDDFDYEKLNIDNLIDYFEPEPVSHFEFSNLADKKDLYLIGHILKKE